MVWRCVTTIIIFLYLLDEDTSLLVTIPAGISAVIEVRTKFCVNIVVGACMHMRESVEGRRHKTKGGFVLRLSSNTFLFACILSNYSYFYINFKTYTKYY